MYRFARSHASTDENKRADFQLLQQVSQVCGEHVIVDWFVDGFGTHPIAIAEPSSVGCDAAESIGFAERESQLLEHDGGHWPAVEEDEDRLSPFVVEGCLVGPEGSGEACWLVVAVEKVTFVKGADKSRHVGCFWAMIYRPFL